MVQETGVQSQVESYRRLKKCYLIPPCLTLSIIRYASRVKWSNPGKGVPSSPTPWCSSSWKGSLLVALDYGRQLYLLIYIHTHTHTHTHTHYLSKIFGQPWKFSFFILEVLFLMKQAKHHNVLLPQQWFLDSNSTIYASFTESSFHSGCWNIFSLHWFSCAVIFGSVSLLSRNLVTQIIKLSYAYIKQVVSCK